MTQSPEPDIGTGLDLKYFIILEQPNRKFALSLDRRNLYIMNPQETNIREYIITRTPESEIKKPKSRWDLPFNDKSEPKIAWHEESGKYSNDARRVMVSVDNLELPTYCQVKISGATKTYKFEKVISIEV